MLENEPEGGERSESVPTGDTAASTTPARRARVSRRKAAAPPAEAPATTEPGAAIEAGSAAEALAATEPPGVDAASTADPPPRTTRRRRKTTEAAGPDPAAPSGSVDAVPPADSDAAGAGATAGEEPVVPPVKATRPRRRKASAAPEESTPQPPVVAAAVEPFATGPDAGTPADADDEPAVGAGGEVDERTAGSEPGQGGRSRGVVPPVVLFMPPEVDPFAVEPPAAEPATTSRRGGRRAKAAAEDVPPADQVAPAAEGETDGGRRRRRGRRGSEPAAEALDPQPPALEEPDESADDVADGIDDEGADEFDDSAAGRRRRRRGRRGRGRGRGPADEFDDGDVEEPAAADGDAADDEAGDDGEEGEPLTRRRRRRRRKGAGDLDGGAEDDVPTVVKIREPRRAVDEVQGVSGSTRLEAKRQRRRDGREQRRTRPPILSESEFLARREAVDRVMVVRQKSDRTQIAVLEDGVLVEHYVARATSGTMVGNVYLGKVQNVLPSMEAAFVDIGRGRNAVLYAGEVNWDATGLEGRARSIEQALKSGDSVLVQVTKDPIGHKGARLTSHIALSGRHLVYVPHGNASGISRKLPDTERKRLRDVLKKLVPDGAGVIVRTAAEGASEDELARDVKRLQAQWEDISAKAAEVNAPAMLSEEPDLVIRVVRDLFNEDFRELVVQGDQAYGEIETYLGHVSPDLLERLRRHAGVGDVFAEKRIDEQILKALDRKVFLPSGGHLVIDRTEAMTVVDVNTGKYTGAGGNLEETVTRNNLEAAEEIVRQLRLRDLGGIVVIDFIDMVLESNRELVLRRLTECLGRDRTKHQVTEITSLGLVQMTRKRIGAGLLEAFSETCEHCKGRGLIIHTEPVPEKGRSGNAAEKVKAVASATARDAAPSGRRRGRKDAEAAPVAGAPDDAEAAETADVVADARAAFNGTAGSGVIVAVGATSADDEDDYDISGYDLSRYDVGEAEDAEPLQLTGADDPDAASDEDDDDADEHVGAGSSTRRRARRGGTRRRTRP